MANIVYCIMCVKIKANSHSRLRYLCTLGFPLIAAILTALLPGLISILVEAVLVSRPLQRLVPPRPPFNKENEISDSVPVDVWMK